MAIYVARRLVGETVNETGLVESPGVAAECAYCGLPREVGAVASVGAVGAVSAA